ncbi:hypothetical protein EVAR_42942_1 [Eumeta japonica]|uniref:FLYWCH-type domain-containing protein n=1 Tax=Eumeta variegata TaxID=151549 RepID=A0A4C1YFF8_EUMVA|nr:hypothetical protein EVAR_42942_1 [Eumeta japonica]
MLGPLVTVAGWGNLYSCDEYELIPSNRGSGHILLYQGHTYARMTSKNRWYCSKKGSGCKAKIHLDDDGQNLEHSGEHDHPPPKLFRTPDGRIHKL